mmetsp:Transcript_32604/g.76120  ORF Transcript_32604/g.76120 Transcript_32604/m.76120 type:complete len:641 (-) Transcript_32604:213-2135(-)|eukprot:s152_g5.t1
MAAADGAQDFEMIQTTFSDKADGNADSTQPAGERGRRTSVVGGEFIKGSELSSQKSLTFTLRARAQRFLAWLADSPGLANFMACVIVVDAICTWVDIDARAADAPPAVGALLFLDFSLALYTAELGIVFCGKGVSKMLTDWIVLLDIIVIVCGYFEIVLNALGPTDWIARLHILRALRLARICRLLRLFRRIRALRELQKLVTMMATCFRTLAWSFLLCFVIMTIWAMLLVEVVHPIIENMPDTFASCAYCRESTRSVMSANLLLFKTVIAGDGWGEVAVPIIEHSPWTALIFVGSLLTLVFGVLNIIIAVVVDTFAEARLKDVENLAEEMEHDLEMNKEELKQLFQRIDKDGSGQLSLEELITGARRDPVLQSRLRVMDIDENDMKQLFCMIDVDNSGTIEASEFIGPLSRWVHDSKTAPRFIKYNMLQTMQLQEDLYNLSQHCFRDLSQRMETLSAGMTTATRLCAFPAQQTSSQESQASQSSHLGADEAGIEQPSKGIKPKMMGPITYLDPTMVSEDAKNAELIRLLEGVVAKVECGMVDLENRLKRALTGPAPDGAHVAPKFSEQVARERSLGVTGGRGDLFRSVYGEARHRDRQNRRKHHSGHAQTGMTLLTLQEVAGRAGSHGELMARHTRSTH